MLQAYRHHVAERAALGIPPLPLSAKQTADLIELLKAPPAGEESTLVELITYRVPAGVDDAAKVKASYLAAVAHGSEVCPLIDRVRATQLLGTMLGGYNISPMVNLLDDAVVGAAAAEGLKKTLLMFDQFHDVQEKAEKGNANAVAVLQSWADGEWLTSRPEVPKSITVSIFKVSGEINTDDLSPAPDAWSRPLAGVRHVSRWLRPVEIVSGVLLVGIGVLMSTGQFATLSAYLAGFGQLITVGS